MASANPVEAAVCTTCGLMDLAGSTRQHSDLAFDLTGASAQESVNTASNAWPLALVPQERATTSSPRAAHWPVGLREFRRLEYPAG